MRHKAIGHGKENSRLDLFFEFPAMNIAVPHGPLEFSCFCASGVKCGYTMSCVRSWCTVFSCQPLDFTDTGPAMIGIELKMNAADLAAQIVASARVVQVLEERQTQFNVLKEAFLSLRSITT